MSESPSRSLPLVFDEPRGRKKPPRHLADLDEAGRKELLTSLGLPGFRAKQLSTHYFSRLVDDPAEMTDLPAAQRNELVSALLPNLMTPIRTLEADKGTTRKTLWRLFDGALVDPWGNTRAAFTASAEVDRDAFGLTWNQVLEGGGVLVGRTVAIEIEAEAVLQGG